MLLEHVFESSPSHCATTCIEEKFGYGSLPTDSKPRPKIGAGPLPDRQYSFAPSFPENSHGWLRLKGYVFDFQTDQFGDSESRRRLKSLSQSQGPPPRASFSLAWRARLVGPSGPASLLS